MSQLENILDILRQYRHEMGEHYGIQTLGVFGSVAKGEETATSDVDVVIQIAHPNLLTLSRIRLELEERMHYPVDLVRYRERMNPFLKKQIEGEARYV